MPAGEPTPYDRKAFLTDHVHRVIYALEELDKPVIAAVNGAAVEQSGPGYG
jgi:enoyl-CoA hydratase/carnithine racemase